MRALVLLLIGCGGDKSDAPEPATDSEGAGDDGDSVPSWWDSEDGPRDTADSADSADPLADCADELAQPLVWPTGKETTLAGSFELGQTHIIAASGETRLSPPIIEEREAVMYFTPDAAIAEETDLRVGVFDGDTLLGVMAAMPPSMQPALLEQGLTETALDAYTETAWSAFIPWAWVREGVTLKVGHEESGTLHVAAHTLDGLGAPHTFTVSRSKIVLFGDADFDTTTVPAETVARDFFASSPAAELRLVDFTDWILDEIVIPTADGPRVVSSEDERLAETSESNRWSILKNQFALRMSLANTGRGLVLNETWEGDSSPYSFGTSLALGWVQDDGSYADINDAGLAAGWTGWTALWAWECDNGFIHELGHAYSLAHFTSGTALSWGIFDEYPQDGTNLDTHPWGYDSTRRQVRTWYQVDSGGPVDDGGSFAGKTDPMNGGDSANAITCFPQYTPYYGQLIQSWMQSSPTLMDVEGEVGAWQWDEGSRSYQRAEVDAAFQEPVAVDVPVVTLIGTLGDADEANQIYPPLFATSGNVFAAPDPADTGLSGDYSGAQWFLRIRYADGSTADALIAEGEVTGTSMKLFSLNLALEDEPVGADLYLADAAWPALDVGAATLVHSRDITAPDSLPAVVTVGRGSIANGTLTLTDRCTEGLDCDTRSAESGWRHADTQRHFTGADPAVCSTHDDHTALSVPVVDEDGSTTTLTVYGQRVLSGGGQTVAVPLTDATPWLVSPDLTQSIRLWVPFEDNADLPAGTYTTDGDQAVDVQVDGAVTGSAPLVVDLTVYETTEATLDGGYLHPEGVSLSDSSVYYIVDDAGMGPTGGVWWDDWESGGTLLTVPMVDEKTGEAVTVTLEAFKYACSTYWDLNSGQGASHGCLHQPYLTVASTGNDALQSGHTYASPGSSPLVLHAVRWHDPGSGSVEATFALSLRYTAP